MRGQLSTAGSCQPPSGDTVCTSSGPHVPCRYSWHRRVGAQHRIDDAPRLLDIILAREERLVAAHRVAQHAFVGIHLAGTRMAARDHFGGQAHALVRGGQYVDADRDRDVWADAKPHVVGVLVRQTIDGRRLPQVDDHLGRGDGQALAGANVERHALPAPRIDRESHGGKGFRRRIGRHAGLGPVPAELAAHDVLRRQALRIAFSTLTFSSRIDSLSVRDRRLHREVRQHLEQVVLDDVAHRARLVVERAAPLNAEVLRHGDLDALHVIAVPERLEEARWRNGNAACCAPAPCRGSGRCGRCAPRRNCCAGSRLSSRADARSWPKGFSTMTRAPAVQSGLCELLDDRARTGSVGSPDSARAASRRRAHGAGRRTSRRRRSRRRRNAAGP